MYTQHYVNSIELFSYKSTVDELGVSIEKAEEF